MHRLIVAGVLVALGAAVATSWSGLTFVAQWQLLPVYLLWLTPVMIDVPLIVLTLARGALAKRQVSARWLLVFIVGLTLFSSSANFAHTVDASGFGSLPAYVGSAMNALAPWLILLMTEVLWLVTTRQKISAAAMKARLEATAARKRKGSKRAPRSTPTPTPPAVEQAEQPTLDLGPEYLGIR
jgi:hypothetical protein